MDPLNALSSSNTTPLTPEQTAALKKLHDAATQLEGVFVGMLFKQMEATVPTDGILGKQSNAEAMWKDMLVEKQSDALAKTGSFGIAKMVEQQLRAQVLADPGVNPMATRGLNGALNTAPKLPSALTDPSLEFESREGKP
jgi:Rod binding domain-containing protein